VSLSSPRQIRVISPSRVIGIGIKVISQSRESSIRLLCRKFKKLYIGRTISRMVCIARAKCMNKVHVVWTCGKMK